ncbi:hypothetical protein ABT224_25695 [Streptomyces sp. NPDC001584]|uniref:hypothetical protein n=1 Tax=Streptomyces sp. NPDC001584 TaxID=3154521 RepID=UPI00332553FA
MLAVGTRNPPTADVRLAALPELPFADDEFEALIGNFVLNPVGQPRSAFVAVRMSPTELTEQTRYPGSDEK